MTLNQRQMIAVFIDNAGQHIAGALEYRHPGSRVVFRHRHHLFNHLQVETAEQDHGKDRGAKQQEDEGECAQGAFCEVGYTPAIITFARP